MRSLGALAPQAQAASELERLCNELANEVPALAPALRSAAGAQAKGDVEEVASSHLEIRRVSDEHRAQVDDFFRRHPEVDALVATVEGEPPQSA